MKKANDASPNRVLKREREQRCWSQLEVADHIGTTAFNVSRWERGITFPGSYFRQQLCQLFEKTPQELGFINEQQQELPGPPPASRDLQAPALVDEEESRDKPGEQTASSPLVFPVSTSPAADEAFPLIWNVPYRHNPFFTGREETLRSLYTTFNPGGTPLARALALSGLGGIGKTQTALEYVYRYRHTYRVVLWVRADTREVLLTDFASLAALLALPEKNDQDQNHAVAAVKRWLRRQSGWLLVLDNADDLEMVSDFLPEVIEGHLLLTTRAQSTGQIAQCIPMEKLSVEESIWFVLRRAKLLTSTVPLDTTSYVHWSQAKPIAEIMDGLPLALDQAAAYIEETHCGLTGYIKRYQQRSMTLLRRRGGIHPDHPESIAATWSLSFEKIEQRYPAAAELLRLCAFLHPDAIAEDILIAGASELTPHLHLLCTDPFEMDNAIGVLTTFSLLRCDPETHIFMLHRLVQVVLREQMNEETRRLWAERAIQAVDRAFPSVNFTTWQECQQCLPHALTCVECIEQLHIAIPAALSLLNKVGSYLRERAQYGEAARLLTNALTLSETTVPTDARMLAESLNNLGLLAHDQGQYIRSEDLLQRALVIYEQLLGPEHLVVAQCLSNQAENYRVQAKHSQMESLVRRALAIREKALGSEHPDVAKSLNQLANLYHGQNKYSLAEPLYQRALAILQQTFGLEHVDVAENLNNLAYLYDALGRYGQAEPLYQQALAFCERNLGARHMYTAISLYNLAEVYRQQGKYGQAEQLHQRALEIREQLLGLDHPHVARSLNQLAEIYLARQKYSESAERVGRALEIWKKAVGEEHHYMAPGLDTLARLRCMQGCPAEARPLAARALALFRHAFGDGYQVADSFNTLAEISYAQKDYAGVEDLLQQALQIQEQVLGAEHPAIARSLHNLAVLCTAQGEYMRATDYCARALTIRRQALLPEHPDLLATEQHYADLLRRRKDGDASLDVRGGAGCRTYDGVKSFAG